MDIAPRHSLQSPLKYAHEAFPTPILPQAKTYLSVDDALQLIDRKITNIRVPITFSLDTPLLQFEYDCETVRFTTRVVIKPLMVALLGVCMILAIYQFIDKAETQGFTDHSQDITSDYQYRGKAWDHSILGVNGSGFWVNHTGDVFRPDTTGLWTPLLLSTLMPTSCLLVAWKVFDLAVNYFITYKQNQIEEQTKELKNLKNSMQCSSPKDYDVPLEEKFLPLMLTELLDDDSINNLSFSQIDSLRKYRHSFFENMLNSKMFSIEQTICWHKFLKMISTSSERLRQALNNPENRDLLLLEPHFLQCLIQEIPAASLKDEVIRVLCQIVQSLEGFECLSTKQCTTLIHTVSTKKSSLLKAFRDCRRATLTNDTESIELVFPQLCHEQKSYKVSLQQLCISSSYFNAMLNGSFKEREHKKINIEDADPNAFRTILDHMETSKLIFDDKIISATTDIDHIDALLEIANKYAFIEFLNDMGMVQVWVTA